MVRFVGVTAFPQEPLPSLLRVTLVERNICQISAQIKPCDVARSLIQKMQRYLGYLTRVPHSATRLLVSIGALNNVPARFRPTLSGRRKTYPQVKLKNFFSVSKNKTKKKNEENIECLVQVHTQIPYNGKDKRRTFKILSNRLSRIVFVHI